MQHSDPPTSYADAERACRDILAARPGDPDALRLLAGILCQRNDLAAAIPLLAALLKQQPRDAKALRALGRALRATGQHATAVCILANGSAVYPDDVEIWFLLGLCLFETGHAADAAAALQRALALSPGVLDTAIALGAALTESGRLEESETFHRQALARHPRAARLHAGLGAALVAQEKLEPAVAAYGEAARLAPDHAGEWLAQANHTLGLVLRRQAQHQAALAALQQAIALKPRWPDAHNNLGLAFKDLGRLDEAIACYRQAIALDPRHPIAHVNLGVALNRIGRSAEALEALQTAMALAPDRADVSGNMANVLQTLGRIDDSREMHEQAVALDPANAKARNNRALSILLCGDLALGFAEYEWRRRGGASDHVGRSFDRPEWTGEPLAGRALLLHAEQGLGDTMQFVRYIPLVQAMGAAVVLQAQRPLVSLLRLSFPGVRVAAQDEAPPPFDLHCPLMSLPWRLGTTLDTIPAEVPYLAADPGKMGVWRERLAHREGLKVGLVWAGNPKTRHDGQRSIAARTLLERLPRAGVALYSLQKEIRPHDQAALAELGGDVVDLAASLEDFSDTAAAVSALDLVISIDSAVVHLAGALGRPAWMLTPYALDWRWLRERADSPWYPTLRLFRQPRPGAWDDVLAWVADALRELAAGRAVASAA